LLELFEPEVFAPLAEEAEWLLTAFAVLAVRPRV
jgi:hypothetical protein